VRIALAVRCEHSPAVKFRPGCPNTTIVFVVRWTLAATSVEKPKPERQCHQRHYAADGQAEDPSEILQSTKKTRSSYYRRVENQAGLQIPYISVFSQLTRKLRFLAGEKILHNKILAGRQLMNSYLRSFFSYQIAKIWNGLRGTPPTGRRHFHNTHK
jgi:hypothetical protein